MEIMIKYDYAHEDLKALPLVELTRFVLEHENKPTESEVSISFVANDTIAALNKKYRQKDEPTDVLSFECDSSEGEDEFFPSGDQATFTLGDVIIAPDVAKRQMKEYGTSFEEEISLLLVHGLLHLCGYDHKDDEEAEQMEELEAELLDSWTKMRTL